MKVFSPAMMLLMSPKWARHPSANLSKLPYNQSYMDTVNLMSIPFHLVADLLSLPCDCVH